MIRGHLCREEARAVLEEPWDQGGGWEGGSSAHNRSAVPTADQGCQAGDHKCSEGRLSQRVGNGGSLAWQQWHSKGTCSALALSSPSIRLNSSTYVFQEHIIQLLHGAPEAMELASGPWQNSNPVIKGAARPVGGCLSLPIARPCQLLPLWASALAHLPLPQENWNLAWLVEPLQRGGPTQRRLLPRLAFLGAFAWSQP